MGERRDTATRQVFFLSALLRAPIRDRQGERLGRITDLIVRLEHDTFPAVTGLVTRTQGRDVFLPRAQIASLGVDGAVLTSATLDLQRFARRDGEVLLAKDVLDRQLIDVDGRRIVRVNDIELAAVGGAYRLIGVDIGGRALLRRLGPTRLARRLGVGEVLDWRDLEYFASNAPGVRLRVSHERVARLHPVEIARLLDTLTYQQGAEVIAALDAETAAETLQEMAEERQVDIVDRMDAERAADILEEMDPGDAADLLQDLSERKAEDLLGRMDPDDRADLRELLAYEEDSAGGIMTNNFLTVSADLTVGAALAQLRTLEEEPDLLYYLYVVPAPGTWRLLGVVSLRDLLLRATIDAPLRALMVTDLVTVRPDEPARVVARKVADYNLLALPVVDDVGDIVGIVTVDDAMDLLLPEEWRPRVPKVFR